MADSTSAKRKDPSGRRTTRQAGDHEDYTSLKRSLSAVSAPYTRHPERIMMEGSQSSKPSRHLKVDIAHPKVTEIAFAALQNLPIPLLVLSSLKTVVLANEAMGRLLGLRRDAASSQQESVIDVLKGQTLSQIGIDMLQDGIPVWISWERFLENLAASLEDEHRINDSKRPPTIPSASTPTSDSHQPHQVPAAPQPMDSHPQESVQPTVHDRVVDVMVSYHNHSSEGLIMRPGHSTSRMPNSPLHTNAQMIISIWHGNEGEQYYTLTFTTTAHRTPTSRAPFQSSQSSTSALQSGPPLSSTGSSPSGVSLTCAPLPRPETFTHIQKLTRVKDAMLSNMDIPVVGIWRDESAVFPNQAARKLFAVPADAASEQRYDFMSRFKAYTADFGRELEEEENPMLNLCRTQKAFSNWKIGLVEPKTGKPRNFDVDGKPVVDERTGEFLVGLVAFKDVTEYTEKLATQNEENEQQFELICDTMPQMLWTTTPDGYHDYFSQRWYDYTGLTREQSVGMGWRLPFHPDDMPATTERWAHSLATGDEYTTEYRCRRADGAWRWMLGRALPLRDVKTAKIIKWFGTCELPCFFTTRINVAWGYLHSDSRYASGPRMVGNLPKEQSYMFRDDRSPPRCNNQNFTAIQILANTPKIGTDIQDLIEIRESNRETHERLLCVLKHAQMSMWQVDQEAKVTFYEGGTTAPGIIDSVEDFKSQILGRNLYGGLASYTKQTNELKASVDRVLSAESDMEIIEMTTKDNSRWFRSRVVAQKGNTGTPGTVDEHTIVGAIGISMEVTELKKKEEEYVKLLAAEAAAKEANKMKSNFLANMSHEIRTPIAGIIGMSELIMDTALNEEQTDFAQNIQRSANTLLTVINDILDFSKIESGRLDIEEVQFSLSVVLRDVSKMLSFAAERKKLQFQSDIKLGEDDDLILLGDPGRVRQILTNLLTNSIKFTPEGGRVRLAVHILTQTSDNILVEFIVGDTGIGIAEDAKPRLFKPFSQADSSTARRFGGTGLGLSICKNLIDLMQGKIKLESRQDSGTVATFSIPFNKPQFIGTSTPLVDVGAIPERLQSELSLSCDNSSQGGNLATGTSSPYNSPKQKPTSSTSPDTGAVAPPLKTATIGAASRPGHILVVEDNTINQQIALKTIRHLGYSASAVSNGQEALRYLLRATENATTPSAYKPVDNYKLPSLILMDVQMPVLDGYRATHTLRRHAPFKSMTLIQQIPIVAMTASAIQGDREKCERAGMNDYLAKPVKRTTLEKMIHKWITAENQLGPTPTSVSIKPEDRDSARPDLCRSGTASTDHSSNCPGADYQISEAQNDGNIPGSRRVSNAQSPLKSVGMSRIESASERGLRFAETAEMAASLRDAKLISAAIETDEYGVLSSTVSLSSTAHPSATGRHMYEAYPDQHGASLELTEENIEKLNADSAEDCAAKVQTPPTSRGWPGDPVCGLSVAPVEPLDSIPIPAATVSEALATPLTDSLTGMSPKKSKRGQLSPSDRQLSDWSNASTVKPSRE